MRYAKILGLTAVAAGLLAFVSASSASATTLTCGPSHCPVGTVIHAESEGHIVFDAPVGDVTCNSTIQGKTTNTGSSTETVQGIFESHVYTGCTGGAVVQVLAKGSFEIHTQNEPTNNFNGTVTSTGTRVTIETFGSHCIFETNNTHLGTITGSANTGATATWDLDGTALPRVGGRSGAFCGSSAPLTGSYLIDSPMVLNTD